MDRYVQFSRQYEHQINALKVKNTNTEYLLLNYQEKLKVSESFAQSLVQSAQSTIGALKEQLFKMLDTLRQKEKTQEASKEEIRKLQLQNQDIRIRIDKVSEDHVRSRVIKKNWVR